jgi:hypothetical protein
MNPGNMPDMPAPEKAAVDISLSISQQTNLPERTGRNAIGWFMMHSNLCSLQPSMP